MCVCLCYQRDIQDTYNAAVGGFLTICFEGHEEEQEPTVMQVAIAQAKREQRQRSPEESSRDRRKKGKSRAELDNAKRPFSFRTDPVNLAYGEIEQWEDVAAIAVREPCQRIAIAPVFMCSS
eukprot:COSAG02_NODE_1944_length_10307_cov_7.826019_10_plen_122_part_00